MKAFYLLTLTTVSILSETIVASADQERFVTITIVSPSPYSTNTGGATPFTYSWGATNTVQIGEDETAEVISVEGHHIQSVVSKNGVTVRTRPEGFSLNHGGDSSRGTTVAGPASFTLFQTYDRNEYTSIPTPDSSYQGGLMTLKIMPMTPSPEKTLTVAPGMGMVKIELESSTNLVNWAMATNGVYSDALRFFRVKLTKLPQ